jgi:hypothetical protein
MSKGSNQAIRVTKNICLEVTPGGTKENKILLLFKPAPFKRDGLFFMGITKSFSNESS